MIARAPIRPVRRRQRGATLFVGLILLILATLIVLVSFQVGKTNLAIVGNAQQRSESIASAQQTIEAAISSPLLTTTPGNVFPDPCGDQPNTLCYDVNGDGKDDVSVTLEPRPTCVKAETIKNENLDFRNEDDRRCTVQVGQAWGVVGTPNTDSLCSNSLWDIRALATDTTTRASAVVDQGVAVRVRTVDVLNACPMP